MDLLNKKTLFINISNKTYELKAYADLKKYIGGVGLGAKLMEMYSDLDPIIFSIGPLNGLFPFASKTAVLIKKDSFIEDIYLGGYLSTRIKFCNLDSIVVYGKSSDNVVLDIHNDEVKFLDKTTDPHNLGLPGKKSSLVLTDKKILLDDYFEEKENKLAEKFKNAKLTAMVITGTHTLQIKNQEKYNEIYKFLLDQTTRMQVEKGFFPSCSGCPMGCEKSKKGEEGGNILVHSLTACLFAQKIYSDVGTVFSCLNVLGYDYTHEDIENYNYLVTQIFNK